MAEFNMKKRTDIVGFFFPCQNCQSYKLHWVYEQPTGLAIVIPFTRTALASTGKGYHIICGVCTFINGRLKSEDVHLLTSSILPKSIYQAYPEVKNFYLPGSAKLIAKKYGNPNNPDLLDELEAHLTHYRLEI